MLLLSFLGQGINETSVIVHDSNLYLEHKYPVTVRQDLPFQFEIQNKIKSQANSFR